jgi:hypothetical protein
LDAVDGVHQQQDALARREGAIHLLVEVDVPRGVDEVEEVGFPRLRVLVEHAGALRAHGDAPVSLDLELVQDLPIPG